MKEHWRICLVAGTGRICRCLRCQVICILLQLVILEILEIPLFGQVCWTTWLLAQCHEGTFALIVEKNHSKSERCQGLYLPMWAMKALAMNHCRAGLQEHPELRLRLMRREDHAKVMHLGGQALHRILDEEQTSMWMFPKIGVSQNGWFIMEHPIF